MARVDVVEPVLREQELSNEVLGAMAVNPEIEEAMLDNSVASKEHVLPPPWFAKAVKEITGAWFDPKSFEQNPELYEKLGVRLFKKWMPTSGDLVYRLVWKKFGAPDWVRSGSMQSLKTMETFTRLYETIHVVFLSLGIATLAAQLHTGQLESAAVTAGLNTLVNVYPIMVQRYNRTRLYAAMNKMEAREKNVGLTQQIDTE